jgi:hypothetical protein
VEKGFVPGAVDRFQLVQELPFVQVNGVDAAVIGAHGLRIPQRGGFIPRHRVRRRTTENPKAEGRSHRAARQ